MGKLVGIELLNKKLEDSFSQYMNKQLLVIYLVCIQALGVNSQNLFPNPGFEEFNDCPTSYSGIITGYCTDWNNIAGSPDYFNCSFYGQNPEYGTPASGTGVVGMIGWPNDLYCNGELQRESIQTNLIEPMKKCKTYRLSFKLMIETCIGTNATGYGSGCLSFGFNFYKGSPPNFGNNSCGCWSMSPTISLRCDSVKIQEYTTFTFDFVALDNYDKVAIGPVCSDTMFSASCIAPQTSGGGIHSAYFNLDDLSLIQIVDNQIIIEENTICQGDTVIFIENKIDSIFNWQWECSGGIPLQVHSDSAIFNFTQSGIYNMSLITESNCGSDTLSLAGIVVNPIYQNVDLDSSILICRSENYFIPDFNSKLNYQWSDNAVGELRYFKESGLYYVVATDNYGCHSSSDIINVIFLEDGVIYPNPTIDSWKSSGTLTTPNSIRLYDANGKVIKTWVDASSVHIDCNTYNLQTGEYYMHIETTLCEETIKLIFIDN